MMMLRVNALYGGKRFAVIFLAVLWLNTIGVFSWLLTGIMTVKHPDGIRGCALVLPFGPLATLSSTLPVVFDSAVLVLTLRPTYSLFRSRMGGHIVKILVEDGILYYLVISKCNLILTIMIATAPPGYRNIMGQITQLMTVTMMSRITIHLRAETRRKQSVVFSDSMNTNSHAPVQFVQAERATTSMQSVGTSSSWFALDARENANNAEDRRVSFLGEEAYEMWVLPTIRE
ncbi:hypothetical protein BD410DRAFT_178489 [Rickenella mellea]|uniref:Uncharacterized protein n=1 Tax=Rickenella mellea TaxID=50990 RepID=A0A4Y7Q8Y8_9AGAM|nr:hypothetical protein BD410DRAFT_178489 [Rickenella mellea]